MEEGPGGLVVPQACGDVDCVVEGRRGMDVMRVAVEVFEEL